MYILTFIYYRFNDSLARPGEASHICQRLIYKFIHWSLHECARDSEMDIKPAAAAEKCVPNVLKKARENKHLTDSFWYLFTWSDKFFFFLPALCLYPYTPWHIIKFPFYASLSLHSSGTSRLVEFQLPCDIRRFDFHSRSVNVWTETTARWKWRLMS